MKQHQGKASLFDIHPRHKQAQSLPLSPSRLMKKRLIATDRRLSPGLTRSSSSSTLATPSLSALRARNRAKLQTPDPAIAGEVIREYLLPMFEADIHTRKDAGRSPAYGTTRLRGLEAIPGTILGELKLSDHLSKEVMKLNREIEDLKRQLREMEQRSSSAESEVNYYKEKCVQLEGHLRLLKLQFSITGKEFDDRYLTVVKLMMSVKTMQEGYLRMEEEFKRSNTLLQEQYAIIDKLRNKETSQEHTSSLLQMENDIIGERLKGLYFAIEHAVDHKAMEEKLSTETEISARVLMQLADFVQKLVVRLDEILVERDKLVEDMKEVDSSRTEMKAERDKIAKIAKEKMALLQGQLQKCEEEKEKMSSDLARTEQSFKDLTEEYEKLRQKAKQYKLRRKQFGEEEEKVCRNCQRVFMESENYNWSCRRHQSEYSGEIYWCCGKAGKDTQGCKISKHESKEEEEEQDVGKEAAGPSSKRCSVLLTQSCRKLGHSNDECPRDPNIRSTFDAFDEVRRVAEVLDSKRHADAQVPFSAALEMMTARCDVYAFNSPDADSSHTDSDSSSSSDSSDSKKREFFIDIKKIKRKVAFSQDAVKCI